MLLRPIHKGENGVFRRSDPERREGAPKDPRFFPPGTQCRKPGIPDAGAFPLCHFALRFMRKLCVTAPTFPRFPCSAASAAAGPTVDGALPAE